MIAGPALGAGKAPGDPVDQRLLVDREFDHQVELSVAIGEQQVERLGLVLRAWKSVEDRALVVGMVEPLTDQGRDDRVADQFTRSHHGLGFQSDRGPRRDCVAKHVASGQMNHSALGFEPLRLGPLAGTRGAQENDVHYSLHLFARRHCHGTATRGQVAISGAGCPSASTS